MLTGAQVMVKCLEAEGIKAVFGYPGVAICPFYDSLYDSGIRNILVRQEQNGGHMASGYARVTRKPAVCVATSGPGATNLITALATAYADSIPLIAITGQVSSELLGKDVFQEARLHEFAALLLQLLLTILVALPAVLPSLDWLHLQSVLSPWLLSWM